MVMNNDRILRRIKGLLALAEDNKNMEMVYVTKIITKFFSKEGVV